MAYAAFLASHIGKALLIFASEGPHGKLVFIYCITLQIIPFETFLKRIA